MQHAANAADGRLKSTASRDSVTSAASAYRRRLTQMRQLADATDARLGPCRPLAGSLSVCSESTHTGRRLLHNVPLEIVSQPPPLAPRPPGSSVPLTCVQGMYWRSILAQRTCRSLFRNIAASLRLFGPLDIGRLEQSIQLTLNRHESLRIRIAHFDPQKPPVQTVGPARIFRLAVVDLSQTAPASGQRLANQLARNFFGESIDLTVDPVFDARLLKLSAYDHVLLLALDHIVSDATSYPILTREILSTYGGGPQAPGIPAPEVSVQFPDYALWHHRATEAWQQRHAPYWDAKLSDFNRLALPSNAHHQDSLTDCSNAVPLPFGPATTAELREMTLRERCLLPLVLLSLYSVIMSRWCERNDLLISFLSHGRYSHPALRGMIGCIAHPVFLRIDVNPNEHIRDLLRRVTAELHSSLSHDPSHVAASPDTMTELDFNWLPSEWDLSGASPPLDAASEPRPGALRLERFSVDMPVTKKFSIVFSDAPPGVSGMIWYSGNFFVRATLERLACKLRQAIDTFYRHPDISVCSLHAAT